MPKYRNAGYDKHSNDKWYTEQEKRFLEPDWNGDDEEQWEEKKETRKPRPSKFLFPFKVEVRVIPCDEFDRPQYR